MWRHSLIKIDVTFPVRKITHIENRASILLFSSVLFTIENAITYDILLCNEGNDSSFFRFDEMKSFCFLFINDRPHRNRMHASQSDQHRFLKEKLLSLNFSIGNTNIFQKKKSFFTVHVETTLPQYYSHESLYFISNKNSLEKRAHSIYKIRYFMDVFT